MTTTAKTFLKGKQINHLLTWVSKSVGSPMETRYVRLTYDVFEKSKLKLQVKLPTTPRDPADQEGLSSLKNKMNYPGLVYEKNAYVKKDFSPEEAKVMLRDALSVTWESTRGDDNNKEICLKKNAFVRSAMGLKDEKLLVEYGSPNIAKPLHMGHLRSLVTGHFVARICKAAGHDVKSICFLGDWGTQFGILQAGLAKYIPETKAILSSVEKLTLDELLRYYVKAVQETETNALFFQDALKCSAELEQGDSLAIEVWKSIREKTITHLKTFWSLFNINYDVIQGESEFPVHNSFTQKAIKQLTDLGVIEVGEDNCIYAVLPPDEKFSNQIKIPLVKKDGSSLYLLRDVACAMARQDKFAYDRIIYVVDKTQAQHFISLFRLLEKLEIQKNQYNSDKWLRRLRHLMFGKVEGMSTRSGNFVLLSEVITTGSSIMQENRSKSPNVRNVDDQSIATQLAISALIVNSLKTRRNKDVRFDWNEALKPVGETGVNLQYTHARICSLEKKAKDEINLHYRLLQQDDLLESQELSLQYLMDDPVALNLAVTLANFEDAFWASYGELEPCILLSYMFKLSDKVSKALKHLKVVPEENSQIANTRLILFILSRRVLAFGMHTLGIKPLDEI